MPLALDDDHRALAESVAGFANRHAPIESTRARFHDIAAGKPGDEWEPLVRQGLHSLHLPEEYGGAGASLPELTVVAEQMGRALVPGPWLPTAMASAFVAASSAEGPPPALLASFAEGATGALATAPGLVATSTPAGWSVAGTSGPALGLPGADEVVVRAEVAGRAGEELWFRLDHGAGTVHVGEGVDLTRSVGRLELHNHVVDPNAEISAPDPDRVDLIMNALLAAEAAGVASWALATAVEHVTSRHQFGRPVGSFQVVQHKAALMLVRTEIACAAAWDAARAEHHPIGQQRLAAAQAALTALPAGIDVALECITLLGGIGFTWEHDAHLYWRRAISVASVAGTEDQWASRLGEAALTTTRDFSFVADDALPGLRARVGGVLDEVLALPEEGSSGGWAPARGGSRQARLAEAGLVAPHYQAPYGLGAGPEEQAVIAAEFARRDLTPPTTMIGEWVLPTLLAHGTEEQQQRFVEPTLRGEIIWCQLFSEPGAGSDLAGLATRAVRVPGGWSLTGQKVWTSMAHEADWGVCLARTDPDAPKHDGLSYFLVDMHSQGVDARPLRQATGQAEFNEVFLDDVFVPDECMVADAGDGWRLAVTTLSNERLSMGAQLHHGSAERARTLVESGAHGASLEDAVRVLGRNTGREMALSALNLRSVLGRMSALDVGAEISVQKVFNAIAQRDGSRAIVSLLGPDSAVVDDGHAIDHIGLPAVLFGGGTIEVQLNVIAQRVLGLPR